MSFDNYWGKAENIGNIKLRVKLILILAILAMLILKVGRHALFKEAKL